MKKVAAEEDCPIIALDSFIQATRDSGYKGTASAISELIDNSLQAKATRIDIAIKSVDGPNPVQIEILDNGCGMDPFTLRQALRFGGSSRFGDRGGLGRYGMGLPNSSLSQARRVVVYTWQSPTKVKPSASPENVLTSYLDVDEIASGALRHVPVPRTVKTPEDCRGQTGTLVVWERCDRLDNRRISTLERKLAAELGRRFRHFIWGGVRIAINGTSVEGIDPLFLNGKHVGAELFGEELRYEIAVDPEDRSKGTSTVRVRFTELPVREWGSLSNEEKASRGISKGSGVSIVRAGREVDYGWFLMGDKRRENYDDWWRCEVQFEPVLDEAFGITHTKQQVRPQSSLAETLSPDLEEIARTLNSRARRAYLALKNAESFQEAAQLAAKGESQLKPLPARPEGRPAALMGQIKKQVPALRSAKGETKSAYTIVEASLKQAEFFGVARDAKQVVLVVNPDHPFFKRVYKPLAESDAPRDKDLKVALELMLLAAARSEAAAGVRDVHAIAQFRAEWSKALATYLNGR